MKKNLLTLFILIMSVLGLQAQMYTSPNGTSNNVFPFRSTTNMVQWIYFPSDFTPAVPAGFINKLYIRVHPTLGTNGVATYTNLTIKMGHTNATATFVGPWMTGMSQVYFAANVSFNVILDSWVEIPLQTPFFYNATDNLMMEISQTNYVFGFYIVNNSDSPNRRMWGTVGSTNSSGAGTGLMYMGFDLAPNNCSGTPNNGVAAFTSAGNITCGQTASFELQNASTGPGISYSWMRSTDNGATWTSFGTNATTATLSGATVKTLVKCITHCSHSNESSISNTLTVNVSQIPISLGADTAICNNAAIQLSVASYNPAAVLWDDNSTNTMRTVNSSGNYTVRVTHQNNCISYDTIAIRSGVEPVNPFNASYNLCEDATLQLSARNPGMSYVWTTSATTAAINVTTPGSYGVSITSPDLCNASFSTTVISRPKPVFSLPAVSLICPGDSALVDATAQHGVAYSWSNGATTPSQYLKTEGRYTAVATTEYGCSDSAFTDLVFRPEPFTEGFSYIPGFYQELKNVKFTPINPVDVNTYHWDFGDGAVSQIKDAEHLYAAFGDYLVTLTVTNDCGATEYRQKISIPTATGIPELPGTVFYIYPNPGNGDITLKTAMDTDHCTYRIYGMDGRLLQEGALKDSKIDATGLGNGNYVLEIDPGKGNVWREKLVIVK